MKILLWVKSFLLFLQFVERKFVLIQKNFTCFCITALMTACIIGGVLSQGNSANAKWSELKWMLVASDCTRRLNSGYIIAPCSWFFFSSDHLEWTPSVDVFEYFTNLRRSPWGWWLGILKILKEKVNILCFKSILLSQGAPASLVCIIMIMVDKWIVFILHHLSSRLLTEELEL